MDLTAELKELRKQLYTYRYKSLELERQLRTHCHFFNRSPDQDRNVPTVDRPPMIQINAFEDTLACFTSVFTNSLIMEMIASHLPVQDLLTCRLVCKLWSQEMSQHLTKRKALVVAYEDCSEAKELLKKKQQGKFVNISTLCILEIPITSQIITDIVKHFGETLSGLKLDDCIPEAKDLYDLLKALPCLEVLSYKQTGVKQRVNMKATESTLDGLTLYVTHLEMNYLKKLVWEEPHPVKNFERIIKMFPGLEDLDLMCWSKPDPNRVIGLRLDSLKNLSISCDNNFSEEHFQALANLNLKLRKLSLRDVKAGGKKRMQGLKAFLQSISSTLTEMNLNGNGRISEAGVITDSFVNQASAFPVDFPVLRKLNIDCSLLLDLKMLDHMPELQKIECKFPDWKDWWNLLNANGVPQNLPNLIHVRLGAIDSGCIKRVATCFTSVTKLDVSEDRIDDIALRTIATMMPQLNHLRIVASTNPRSRKLKITDHGVTGIPAEECVKLLDAVPEVFDSNYIDNVRKHEFIGNLKVLHSLELACSDIDITDVAILYGISALKRINTITLPNCKLTNASLAALGDLPNLLVLELDKRCGVTQEGVVALRTKKRNLVVNLYADVNSRMFS